MARNIRYLILLLTNRCNLNCSYCYRGAQKSGCSMSRNVAKKAISIAARSGKPFHLQLSGGEPTMEPELIEWVAWYIRSNGFAASIGIQTNGTRLDDTFADVFLKYDIQVGISLDGVPGINDVHRGKTSEVLKGMDILSNKEIEFRVTTVITDRNIFDLSRLILMLGAYPLMLGIGFDLLVKKGNALISPELNLPDPDDLEKGLQGFVEALEWINRRRRFPISVREIELLRRKKGRTSFCHAAAGESMAVTPSGEIYPCSQTSDDPDFFCGTVDHPEFHRLDMLGKYRLERDECSVCNLAGVCPGECPGRLYYNGLESSGLACSIYRTLWSCLGGDNI